MRTTTVLYNLKFQLFKLKFVPVEQYALLGISIALFIIAVTFLPYQGIDLFVLYSAGKAVLNNVNPYTIDLKFYTPFWSLFLLAPLSLLPLRVVHILWTIGALIIWNAVFKKLKIPARNAIVYMFNPFFVVGLILGSYDWLSLVGMLLPMSSGIWFLALKPQVTLGAMMWWANEKGLAQTIKVYIIPFLILVASFFLGWYRQVDLSEMTWNNSLGLLGFPVGVFLLFRSYVGRDYLLAIAATPFLSPYVAIQTWAIGYLLLIRNPRLMIIANIIAWIWFYAFW